LDKKEAEKEASRKAKEAQNAAGKNVGMSGRDLVSLLFCIHVAYLDNSSSSSNTIQSGSRTKKKILTIGTLLNTDGRRKRKTWLQRKSGLRA
jgi:hypothetical protein